MRTIPLLVAAAVLLAGCVTPDEPVSETATADSPALFTDPSVPAPGIEEGMPGWHVHDYWNGQTRLVAVHGEVTIGAVMKGWAYSGGPYVAYLFRGDPGMIVPLGTERIEVVVEVEPGAGVQHGPPELWVKPPNESEARSVARITPGEPIVIPITEEQADPPHQVLSRWRFYVVFPNNGAVAFFHGTVRLHAEAIKGLPIPAFPPHPDPWQGQTEISLIEGDERSDIVELYAVREETKYCLDWCIGYHRPGDAIIVPLDASEVVVTLQYQTGMTSGLGLRYHGSDTWDFQPIPGREVAPGRVEFRIPVTPRSGDSPYAMQSLWEFQVFNEQPTPYRAFVGGYRLSAVVLR